MPRDASVDSDTPLRPSFAYARWFRDGALEPLYEVNARCVDLLVKMAAASDSNPPPLDLVAQLRDVLRRLDAAARHRAAHSPLLLVDLEFRNAEWWRLVKRQPERNGKSPAWLKCFPRRPAVQLARATLTIAWHVARADREAATIMLGLLPAVAEVIASLSLHEIDRLAERHFRHVRPRWEDRPTVWRDLFLAAQGTNSVSMRDVTVHGVQLLGGELIGGRLQPP